MRALGRLLVIYQEEPRCCSRGIFLLELVQLVLTEWATRWKNSPRRKFEESELDEYEKQLLLRSFPPRYEPFWNIHSFMWHPESTILIYQEESWHLFGICFLFTLFLHISTERATIYKPGKICSRKRASPTEMKSRGFPPKLAPFWRGLFTPWQRASSGAGV